MKLAEITGNWIGRSYNDYGCLDFCYQFLKALGFDPPDTIGDWSVDNYTELVAADIKNAQKVMIRAFLNIGEPAAHRNWPKIGDLLVIKQKGLVFFPAVYVGRGLAMASFIKKGVVAFRIDTENKIILARRLS